MSYSPSIIYGFSTTNQLDMSHISTVQTLDSDITLLRLVARGESDERKKVFTDALLGRCFISNSKSTGLGNCRLATLGLRYMLVVVGFIFRKYFGNRYSRILGRTYNLDEHCFIAQTVADHVDELRFLFVKDSLSLNRVKCPILRKRQISGSEK